MDISYISSICKKCGAGYTLAIIDLELCIYKDLGNGYEIEVSCVNSPKHPAWIYIWENRSENVKTFRDVSHDDLPIVLQDIERRYKTK